MKFRKKPVVIDAFPCHRLLHWAANDWKALPDWVRAYYDIKEKGKGILFRPDGMDISTLEGVMTAEPADWVIRGVKGEIYPCKPDIFEATYEPAE